MRLKDVVEIFYLGLTLRWERRAPEDGHQGELDGDLAKNTQAKRLASLLTWVAAGNADRAFEVLSSGTRRKDGKSSVSRDSSWMNQPEDLKSGWYLEGCINLEPQKREIIEQLKRLGLTPEFVTCAFAFVAGKTVKPFMPTPEE